MASIGAILGIPGTVFEEFLYGSPIAVFTAVPMIEEAFKPTGLYLLLAFRPHYLENPGRTAALAAVAGLVFGIVESIVYVLVYFPDKSAGFMVFRFTVTPAVHATCSYVFGWGINQRLKDSLWGKVPFLSGSKRYFIAAIVLHGLYNLGATIFAVLR